MTVVQVPRRFVRTAWGGTETVVAETGRRLIARGHRIEILCPDALADRAFDVIEGVPVRRFPYFYPFLGLSKAASDDMDRKGGNLFSFSLWEALRTYPGLDLIHLHTGKRLGGIGRTVARSRRIPYIVSLHGGVYDVPAGEAATWTAPARNALEWGKLLGWWVGSRRVLDDAAAILCLGPEERDRVAEAHPGKRVVVLPNGVDPERFARGDRQGFRSRWGLPDDSRVLLTVGRIDVQKNQVFAVAAFARLATLDPKLRLVLIGPVTSEAYRSRLEAVIADTGFASRIIVIPGMGHADLVDAFHAADVFLLPSLHEPFGIVVLEAWASGLPVLASRVGGIPSFVEDGRDGLLFAPDDIEDFLRAWQSLDSADEFRLALAEAGRRKARDQYSWDAITDRLEVLYEEVIRENPLRA